MTDPGSDAEEFQDPLENYEPRQYHDALEEALVEQEIGTIRHTPFTTIAPDLPVHEAVVRLADLHVACLLVAENDRLQGVFSERDVLNKVALNYDEVRDRPVRDVMTDHPIYVHETDSAITSLSVMAVCGYRHVPVLDLDEKLTGIVSPQRLVEFLQNYFGHE
jgi:CBS domain-containing protein